MSLESLFPETPAQSTGHNTGIKINKRAASISVSPCEGLGLDMHLGG